MKYRKTNIHFSVLHTTQRQNDKSKRRRAVLFMFYINICNKNIQIRSPNNFSLRNGKL